MSIQVHILQRAASPAHVNPHAKNPANFQKGGSLHSTLKRCYWPAPKSDDWSLIAWPAPPSRLLQTSSQFVESCGAILFRLSIKQVCLIHYLPKDGWLLPKGRRNYDESRHQAALRESERRYQCHLLPVTMPTRAPPANETGDVEHVQREYSNISEPFVVTNREVERWKNVKLIFWYIAEVDEEDVAGGESTFRAEISRLRGHQHVDLYGG